MRNHASTPVLERVTVVSFGYGHGTPPEAHATFDVRSHFRDPHINPAFRYLTAADPAVTDALLATPGILTLAAAVMAAAWAFLDSPQPGPVTIAVGCTGGRHRAPVIAAEVGRLLESAGVPVTLTHRDMHRPLIEHPGCGAS